MSIKKEINNFEFDSISNSDSEIIKNGFFDYHNLILEKGEDTSENWEDNAYLIETILNDNPDFPETLGDILELLKPFEEVAEDEVEHIFRVKRIDELNSYYQYDPFLVSIIEVIYRNIDVRFSIEEFFEELIDLCDILSSVEE